MADELQVARELADIADEIAMRYFTRAPVAEMKEDGTLVTAADTEIETALRARIAEVFPEHAVLGEEHGLQGDASAPIWVLDPIDGTNNFAWGIPVFATLVALRVGGRTEVGVVSAPALGERYEARRGRGARMNGEAIHVSDAASIDEARVCYASWVGWVRAGLDRQWAWILARCHRSRGFGDFWGHMLVARGAADIMAEPTLRIWDVAALEVIVEEAGGLITDFSGKTFDDNASCLSTNGRLHGEVIRALAGV
ncbi:MAG: inositol monophosphatase family protein [Gaiellales bacterium]